MNRKSILTLSAAFLAAFALSADFPLAENGNPRCSIVVKKGAPLPVSFGAKELALFTEKVSSAKIPVTETAGSGKNIFVGTIEDPELVKKSGVDASKLKEDGFYFRVCKGTQIVQRNPTRWKDTPARKAARERFVAKYAKKKNV